MEGSKVYLAGIDGGGTKTECVIGDERGNILSRGISTPSNYQVVGIEAAKFSIQNALNEALENIRITVDEIDYAYLGLAGADLKEDFEILNNICSEIFGKVPFKIVNDSWIGLRAGNDENWGIVTICGTGANTAGRTKDGRELILRGMSYELGNWGGGIDIAKDALYYAFRSEEGTGLKTALEDELPKVLGFKYMKDIVKIIRDKKYDMEKINIIPELVFELASRGDCVCQRILIDMGHALGEMAGGVIKKLGMEKIEVPVTLVGSVFKGRNPLLIDEYTTTVHRVAPLAKISKSKREPVIGAYYLALDNLF